MRKIVFKLPKNNPFGETYAGEYVFEELTAGQEDSIAAQHSRIELIRGIPQIVVDTEKYNRAILKASLKDSPVKIDDAALDAMPTRLKKFLIRKALDLNMLSPEEADFLENLCSYVNPTEP